MFHYPVNHLATRQKSPYHLFLLPISKLYFCKEVSLLNHWLCNLHVKH